ncbi:MAG: ABC transporter ATP-binding protein [Paludibacteraceae bacterium]|nr:ABC transporter ATP-binding protein [Paludibacteraceae bacterium]
MKAVLKLSNLSFGYQNRPILSNVSLEIYEGEVLSLLGNNGSGKSTFGKTISGLLKHLSGVVEFEGKDIGLFSRKEMSKIVRYLPSELFLPDYMTVMDFVSLDADRETSRNVLSDVGLGDFVERYMSELSSGEKQKAMIAASLASESRVVVLDEPLSHLDRQSRIDVLELLRKVAKDKLVSFIVITHEWELARKYSDRVMLLDNDEFKKI